MSVICVIGDLVDSRHASDRRALQERFERVLGDLNRVQSRHLLSPCTITLGDEYQAVYMDADTLFQDFCLILACLHPARIRFSVGLGTLTTAVNTKQAIGMDGPPFHVAREAMDDAFKASAGLFRIRHAERPVPRWLEAGLALVSHGIGSWRPTRLRIFRMHCAGMPVKEMAARLGLSQVAVYKNLQAGALEATMGMIQELSDWINGAIGE
jgi:hypothetical protein